MSWNNLTDQERLTMWRQLRTSASKLDRDGAMEEIQAFTSKMPMGYRSLDYHTPSLWPTPWEILAHNMTCPSAQALLVYYTLVMSGHNDGVELCLVDDYSDQYLSVILGDQWLVGYYPLELVDLDVDPVVRTIKRFRQDEIKKIT